MCSVHCAGTDQTPKKVAFFVTQSVNYGPVCETRDFVFDNVVTNVGSGYSQNTGRFTAPVSATYQFNVSISAQSCQKAAFNLVKNESLVMRIWAESHPNWATSSSSAILSLNAGDQVWLQLRSEASHVYGGGYGGNYTSFSGFLIF